MGWAVPIFTPPSCLVPRSILHHGLVYFDFVFLVFLHVSHSRSTQRLPSPEDQVGNKKTRLAISYAVSSTALQIRYDYICLSILRLSKRALGVTGVGEK